MNITIFESLMKKEAHCVIDAAEWIREIRDGKYKPTVDKVRSMIKLGDKEKAREWKMKLPAAVWAGECRKGRYFKFTTRRTGYAIFDFDSLTEEQISAARQLLEVFPWIVAIHVTASGRGLRVVANIGLVHIDVYRDAYAKVASRLHDLTGLEPDMACKDFARASLASYDPGIYFNPDATMFPYPDDSNPLNYVPATGPDTSEDFRYLQSPVTQALALGYQSESHHEDTAPDVDAVINRFFYTHPYVSGSRTRTMLSLGQYLRWRKVQPWQLGQAISTACARGVEPGITPRDIERAVRWGYEHGDEGGKEQTNWGHYGHNNNMTLNFHEKSSQTPDNKNVIEEETDEEEIVEEQCRPFDDDIYDRLPQEILRLLSIAKDKRDRDITLLSVITISSNLFPALRTIYGNKKYSAHLYTCIIAEAGAGKGVAMNATALARKTDKELDKMYRKAKKEYEKKLLQWEIELKLAIKEHRLPNVDLRPEEPQRQCVIVSPNTSKSQLIIDVKNAGEDGLAIISSEIDTMVESLSTDYGNHAAELRMFFQHEEVRQRFKIDKEPIVIEHPRVAILMTGTHEQIVSLIKSPENGLFSRFLFYMMNDNAVWKSQSPFTEAGEIDVEELYDSLSEKMKENYFRTRGKEIIIRFTREQWKMLDEIFEAQLGFVAGEGKPGAAAMVKRHGLMTARTAMVLCGYRIMEAGWDVKEYTCSDEDFDTALRIVLTALSHAEHVSTMLKDSGQRGKVKNFFRLMPILKRMPSRFAYSEFDTAVRKAGFGVCAAKRALKKYVASGLLSKDNGVYYKTSRLK